MRNYYRSLLCRVPGLLWDAASWYVRIGALLVFIIAMFNQALAASVQSAWRGFSPLWFLVVVVTLMFYGLAKANYLQVAHLQDTNNDLTNRISELTNMPQPNVEFVWCGIEHREMGPVHTVGQADEETKAFVSAWSPSEFLTLPGSPRQFSVVKVRNTPKMPHKEATAHNCTVELEFLDSEGRTLRTVPGRWADTKQPVRLLRTESLDWLDRKTIYSTDHPKTIDIALKDPADDNAFIIANVAIASNPETWKLESMQLAPGTYQVRVTVRVEGQFPFPRKEYILTNGGIDGGLQIAEVQSR